MISEFKQFAMRGNVIDLAVGVVIGAAFGKIVGALVEQVVMPPIGLLIGGVDFTDLKIPLTDEVAIGYGVFLNAVVQFAIVAFAIFLVVKAINRLNRAPPEPEPAPVVPEPSAEEKLLIEIRDLLKQQR